MTNKTLQNKRLVYSSEQGKICTKCSHPINLCVCQIKKSKIPSDGIVRIGRETKKRGGKTVTIISGFSLDHLSLHELAAELKKTCGCGGSVKNGNILIQGDKRELLYRLLKQKGFVVKVIGG